MLILLLHFINIIREPTQLNNEHCCRKPHNLPNSNNKTTRLCFVYIRISPFFIFNKIFAFAFVYACMHVRFSNIYFNNTVNATTHSHFYIGKTLSRNNSASFIYTTSFVSVQGTYHTLSVAQTLSTPKLTHIQDLPLSRQQQPTATNLAAVPSFKTCHALLPPCLSLSSFYTHAHTVFLTHTTRLALACCLVSFFLSRLAVCEAFAVAAKNKQEKNKKGAVVYCATAT